MASAVVLAGRENTGKLKDISGERWEALIPIAGAPMLQYVIDAVSEARQIERVIIVGPEDALRDRIKGRAITYVPPQGGIVANVRAAVQLLSPDEQVIIVTSDVPLITAQTVDGFLDECRAVGPADVYYPILERRVLEARYPTTVRTYAKLREGTYTGGNFFVIKAGMIDAVGEIAEKFVAARKSPLQMAGLLGWSFIIKLLLGRAALPELVERAVRILGAPAQVVETQQAEIGIDVDKPSDFELVEAELAKRRLG